MVKKPLELPVLLVGSDRPMERVPGLQVVRTSWGETRSLGLNGWKVVVLGDRVLTGVNPAEVREFVGKRQVRVIVSPDECDCRKLTSWVQAGFRDLVLPEDLVERLIHREHAVDGRPEFEPRDWLRLEPGRSSPAREAAEAVPNLVRPFAVTEWGETLGWCRQKLWRVCSSSFRTNPKTILWWYVDTVVCKARSLNHSIERISNMLGYSEPAALSHAFQRRNRTIPTKGHRCGYECATCPDRACCQLEAERSPAA